MFSVQITSHTVCLFSVAVANKKSTSVIDKTVLLKSYMYAAVCWKIPKQKLPNVDYWQALCFGYSEGVSNNVCLTSILVYDIVIWP